MDRRHPPFESRDPLPAPTTDARRREALAALPDCPRWVEARGMLRALPCEVVEAEAHGHGFLVVHPVECLAVMVGEPGGRAIRYALASMSPEATLLTEDDTVAHALQALPTWRANPAVLHELPAGALAAAVETDRRREADLAAWCAEQADAAPAAPGAPAASAASDPPPSDPPPSDPPPSDPPPSDPPPSVRRLTPDDDHLLRALPPGELREELRRLLPTAPLVAAFVDDRPVAFCAAHYRTATLWDVGVDTRPEHRRHGLASAAFRHLARLMADEGLSPVWGAEIDNLASLGLAARLGFVATDSLQVVTRAD